MNTFFTASEPPVDHGDYFSFNVEERISLMSCPAAEEGLDRCRDLHFLHKITELIVHHVDDPELGVKELCAATFTSYTQLFRRLKSLTGKNPTSYIRATRLLMAKRRL